MEALLLRGGFYFLIAAVLAHLEIQIEGKDGWAAKLPTWRWQPPWIGRPVTGYLVCLNACLLLLLHLPLLYAPFSLALEAELLCFFFLLTVFWDFQWFLWNPHFGVRGFRKGRIWWYPTWLGPLPTAYYLGLAASLVVYLAPAAAGGNAWTRRALAWGALFAEFMLLTLVSMVAARLAIRPAPAREGETS